MANAEFVVCREDVSDQYERSNNPQCHLFSFDEGMKQLDEKTR
jgi:hypothetical protein